MKALVSMREAQELDAGAQERYGLSADQLMERAASLMLRALEDRKLLARRTDGKPAALALCGRGNNAADALALLRMASFKGYGPLYAALPDRLSDTASRRASEAAAAGVLILDSSSAELPELVRKSALLIDGIAGTGMQGALREPLASLAGLLSRAEVPIVALDLPGGMYGYDGNPRVNAALVRADYSLCVSPLKSELYFPGYRPSAGVIEGMEGVFPEPLEASSFLLEPEDLPSLLPALDRDAHKGERGALGIHAASIGSLGAALIAARAGSASGAGTVTLMLRDEVYPLAAGSLSAQIVRPLSAGPGRRFDAALAGPGLGLDAAAGAIVAELLAGELPLVLDADALRLLPAQRPFPRKGPLVLTPHPGELVPLALAAWAAEPDDADALRTARERWLYDTEALVKELARAYGAVVVLKGSVSWIAGADGRAAVWDGREPSLATGGSGDALSALVAGLLARGAKPFDAALAAVAAHGLAGRELARTRGFYDASDLPGIIGRILYEEAHCGSLGD